ncbi:hypothetical protein BH10PSE19_BH10PSE19_10960 [soil metagenome]
MTIFKKTPQVSCFTDTSLYLRQIDKLENLLLKQKKIYSVSQDGVGFFNFSFEKKRVAKLLAKTVKKGQYQFQPVEFNSNSYQDSQTVFCITDQIIHFALAELLGEQLQSIVPPYVVADPAAESIVILAENCAKYIKETQSSNNNSGIYVWHASIAGYPDNIKVTTSSPIWQLLKQLHPHQADDRATDIEWSLLEQAIRPILLTKEGLPYQSLTILNVDKEITAILDCLYAHAFDTYLANISGGFYARSSEEFIFLHSDLNVIQAVAAQALQILTVLGLKLLVSRTERYYLVDNTSPENAEMVKYQQEYKVKFANFWIYPDGTLGLTQTSLKQFLHKLQQRALATHKLLGNVSNTILGRAICQVFNHTMQPKQAFAEPTINLILKYITNKQQLQILDRKIACIIAEVVSDLSGQVALKQIPCWKINKEWGLQKLVDLKKQII